MTMASADPEPQDVSLPDVGPDGGHPHIYEREGVHSQAAAHIVTVAPSKDDITSQVERVQVQSPLSWPSTSTSGECTVAITSESTFGEVRGNPSDSTSKLTHSGNTTTTPSIDVTCSPQVVVTSPQSGGVMAPTIHIVSAVPQASANWVAASPSTARVSDVPHSGPWVPSGVSTSQVGGVVSPAIHIVNATPQVTSAVTSPSITRVSDVPHTSACVPSGLTPSTTPVSRDATSSTARVPPTGLPGHGETTTARIPSPPTEVPEAMSMLDPMKQQPLYEELNEIGNGAYGTVYRARDLVHAGRVVALKKIRISLTEEGVPVFAIREIATLKQLERFNHPNIVRLLDICQGRIENDRLTLMLVFEYMEQDLDKYLKRCPSPGLEPSRIKSLIHQVVEGVDFLHTNRVIHRDLKPQNILVDHVGRIKIADFGLARIYDFNMRLTTTVVTLWYRAPEVLLSNSYATSVDLWSCGCIFAELFRRRPLFEGRTEGDQLQIIFDVIGTPSESEWPQDVSLLRSNFRYHAPRPLQDIVPEITPDAVDLMQKMLKFKPECRISALEAKNHPYFDSLRASTSGVTAGSSSSSSSSNQTPGTSGSSVPLSPIRSPSNTPRGQQRPGSSKPLTSSPGRALTFSSSNKGTLSPGRNLVLSPRPATPLVSVVPQATGANDENNPNAGNSAAGTSSGGGSSGPSKPVVTAVVVTTSTMVTTTAAVPGPSGGSNGTPGGTANR